MKKRAIVGPNFPNIERSVNAMKDVTCHLAHWERCQMNIVSFLPTNLPFPLSVGMH